MVKIFPFSYPKSTVQVILQLYNQLTFAKNRHIESYCFRGTMTQQLNENDVYRVVDNTNHTRNGTAIHLTYTILACNSYGKPRKTLTLSQSGRRLPRKKYSSKQTIVNITM